MFARIFGQGKLEGKQLRKEKFDFREFGIKFYTLTNVREIVIPKFLPVILSP